MLSNQSNYVMKNRVARLTAVSAVFGVVLGLGGCSADVSRFDLGKYSYNNSDGPTGALPASSGLTPSEPMASAASAPAGRLGESYPRAKSAGAAYDRGYSSDARTAVAQRRARLRTASGSAPDSYQQNSNDVRSSRLDDVPATRKPRMLSSLPREQRAGLGARPDIERTGIKRPQLERTASVITVERGDTLYGLSRRHSVSVAALMSANGLRSPMIRPGQTLSVPMSGDAAAQSAPSSRALSSRASSAENTSYRTASSRIEPSRSDAAMTGSAGLSDEGAQYTVRSGDSLYRIARQHGLRTAQLVAANPDVNPRRLRPGQSLVIPGAGSTAVASGSRRVTSRSAPRVVSTARYSQRKAPRKMASLRNDGAANAAPGIRKINPGRNEVATDRRGQRTKIAALSPASKRKAADRFRWPVSGKVISKFGPRNDGTHNDGINLSVPMGTTVKAAQNGVVVYADSELKGYGKLILLRHDNNWVTAYAHNNSLLVKRGDRIRRGQVIAKAGKTGTVDRPQLHFELRKGSKPVNPLPYLR